MSTHFNGTPNAPHGASHGRTVTPGSQTTQFPSYPPLGFPPSVPVSLPYPVQAVGQYPASEHVVPSVRRNHPATDQSRGSPYPAPPVMRPGAAVGYNSSTVTTPSSSVSSLSLPDRTVRLEGSGFRFNNEQRAVLRESYSRNKYPPYEEVSRLMHELNVPERTVCDWFKRKRKEDGVVEGPGHREPQPPTQFSTKQREYLHAAFEESSSLPQGRRVMIAAVLDLSETVVESWFYRQRQAEKRSKSQKSSQT